MPHLPTPHFPQNSLCRAALLAAGLLAPGVGFAQNAPVPRDTTAGIEDLGTTITQSDLSDRLLGTGHLKNTLIKTETIDARDLQARHALNLSDALECQVGITAGTGCSMCGMKRVRINGMEAEYTTILIDGVPLHSTVSGYYGTDALVSAGVASIEIARGSGAALSSPEAMGGAINIVPQKPKRNGLWADFSAGTKDHHNLALVGTAISEDGSRRLLAAAQFSGQGQEDNDDNAVNEAPSLQNASGLLDYYWIPNEVSQWHLRLSRAQSDVFGGPVTDLRMRAINTQAEDPTFVGGDVRTPLTSSYMSVLEAIETRRDEATLRQTQKWRSNWVSEITLSGAKQEQNSMYEGSDYHHFNHVLYGDMRWHYRGLDKHLLTLGASGKYEGLRSSSEAFFDELGLDSDAFDMFGLGMYAQDVWQLASGLEWGLALRGDNIRVDWLDKTEKEYEVEAWQLSPRTHVRWDHNQVWTSRFSAGIGYRAPLTFFESDHGVLDEGFDVEITGLEKSYNGTYSLAAMWPMVNFTLSAAGYLLENRAYIETEDVERPTLRHLSGRHSVAVLDGAFGVRPFHWLELGLTLEKHFLEEDYKSSLSVAAVEERAVLEVQVNHAGWEWSTLVHAVGARDLEPYGYGDRYERYTEEDGASLPKRTDVFGFATVDTRLSYSPGRFLTVYVGAKNLLDYTQAGEGQSPLFFDVEGGFDVGHIYGPLRGRMVYAGSTVGF